MMESSIERSRQKYRQELAQMCREAASNMRAVGIHDVKHTGPRKATLEERWMDLSAVEDRHDLTGQLMGDPPRYDPRRTWAPHLSGGAA